MNGVCAENLKLLKFFQPTELKVYNENNVTIAKLVTTSKGNFDLNIYYLEGQLIENILIQNNQNKDEIYTKDINISQLLLNKNNMLNNIYFLEMIIEGKKYTKKIYVEN